MELNSGESSDNSGREKVGKNPIMSLAVMV